MPLLGPERPITSFARWWWCRRERPVARRGRCAAPDAALRVPCVVPVVAQFARFAGPDAAPCQTSPCLRAASLARWASWWLGLPPLTPSELLTKRPLQMPPRIQEKRERCADRPAWPLNLDTFFAPVSCHGACLISLRAELLIWINFARSADQSVVEFGRCDDDPSHRRRVLLRV